MKHRFFVVLKYWSLLCLAVAVYGEFCLPHMTPAGNDGSAYPVVAISLLALLIPWFLVWYIAFLHSIVHNTRAAMTPVPSPNQIAIELYKEWGRSPTLEEVMSVHQYLQSEKNQAMVAAGVSLAVVYEMGRHT